MSSGSKAGISDNSNKERSEREYHSIEESDIKEDGNVRSNNLFMGENGEEFTPQIYDVTIH